MIKKMNITNYEKFHNKVYLIKKGNKNIFYWVMSVLLIAICVINSIYFNFNFSFCKIFSIYVYG